MGPDEIDPDKWAADNGQRRCLMPSPSRQRQMREQPTVARRRSSADAIAGRPRPIADDPVHWWPSDRSWVVNRDFDLDELYIACDDELARVLIADSDLEVVESRTRVPVVDWTVDDDRRVPSVT